MPHTVQTDGGLPEHYMPPCIGNGDLILMLDDKGAQSATIPGITERNHWVRPRVWISGRRYEGRYRDMISYGHVEANILRDVAGKRTLWRQTLDVKNGRVETEIHCDGLIERTTTFVLLDRNLLVIHKEFEGANIPESVRFRYVWHMGDSEDAEPDLTEWTADACEGEIPCVDVSYSIRGVQRYEGKTVLFADQPGIGGANGNRFEVEAHVDPESKSVTGFLFFADNLDSDWHDAVDEIVGWCRSVGYEGLCAKQSADWGEFWDRGYVHLPAELSDVQAVWETALYHCRIAQTRWSVGPGFGNGMWAGRYFHDELFPFHALASSNHLDLAARIPRFRRNTLDVAVRQTRGKGARWGWESTEDGFQGLGDMGICHYEIWHMGSFAQEAWEYYRYTGSDDVLVDICYPVIRGCAEFYRNWVIIEVGDGRAVSIPCIDIDEGRSPVISGLCTMMSAAYSMRHAAMASEILDVDVELRSEWLRLAELVEKSAPDDGVSYLPYSGAEEVTLAVIASVFPFMFAGGDENPLAAASVRRFFDVSRKSISWSPEPRHNQDWTWTSGWLASSCARLGWADMASEAAVRGSHTAMTFGAINEHVEHHEDGIRNILPWFTTGAGAYVAGVNDLFVQSWNEEIRIGFGVPEAWEDFAFKLLAAPATVVEGHAKGGRLRSLTLTSALPGRRTQQLSIPARLIVGEPRVSSGDVETQLGPSVTQISVTYEGSVQLVF